MGSLRKPNLVAIFFFGILFQFFFQLLSDFVAAIYAFGLLGTSIPVQIIAVFLLFSPIVLVFLKIEVSAVVIFILGKLVLFTRLVEVLFNTGGRMILSGIGVACFLLFIPTLLRDQARREDRTIAMEMSMGMAVGLALSVLLRAMGSGEDITTLGWWQLLGWALGIMAAAAWVYMSVTQDELVEYKTPVIVQSGAGWWRPIGLSLGIMAVLILMYFVFTSPTVLARWTGAHFLLILAVLMISLTLYTWLRSTRPNLVERLSPALILLWNLIFVITLALTAYTHQVSFPTDPAAYPLAESPTSWLQHIPLLLTLVLFPIILIDLRLLVDELCAIQPSISELGAGFSVASLFLLLMILMQVFTTTYDYIPLIGPLFRDKFGLVHLIAGIILMLAMLLAYKRWPDVKKIQMSERDATIISRFFGVVTAFVLVAALLIAARPAKKLPAENSVKILTYNIQQGYNQAGVRNFEGQLATIRAIDADIIGLQESDLARVSGGNSDIVRYLADRLDMYSYYGPKTVNGTFGVALLSRYPILDAQTYYLFSEGEQVALIESQIAVGDQTFNIFVTHLGNGGPIVQQEELMTLVEGLGNVVAMGDFNFRPESEQYALTTASLDDSWSLAESVGEQGQDFQPEEKIDHIFVTPGMQVLETNAIESMASDHPAVTATLGW